jgi:uncharacterized protein (DUF342 family)
MSTIKTLRTSKASPTEVSSSANNRLSLREIEFPVGTRTEHKLLCSQSAKTLYNNSHRQSDLEHENLLHLVEIESLKKQLRAEKESKANSLASELSSLHSLVDQNYNSLKTLSAELAKAKTQNTYLLTLNSQLQI